MLLWFVFGVFGIVPEVLKMLVFFPVFWAFCGVASSCLFLGLEGLGVFVFLVFLVFVFVVCVAFVSVLFALFLFCCWIVFGVGSCFAFFLFLFCFFFVVFFVLALNPPYFFVLCFFCFLLFCFFGGFKGQVRWPKGPPHLALNPPFWFLFFFVLFFCCLFFLEGLTGQVRWPKGPPHLAFSFCLFLKNRKKLGFPPKKRHFCCSFFCVSLCLFLAFLGPPPF